MGGIRPVSWQEIASFSQMAGFDLEPWEAQQIRAMSVAFVAGHDLGQEPMKVSPAYSDRPDEDPGVALERQRMSDALGAMLSAMASD
jgi:hypothetical protein